MSAAFGFFGAAGSWFNRCRRCYGDRPFRSLYGAWRRRSVSERLGVPPARDGGAQ